DGVCLYGQAREPASRRRSGRQVSEMDEGDRDCGRQVWKLVGNVHEGDGSLRTLQVRHHLQLRERRDRLHGGGGGALGEPFGFLSESDALVESSAGLLLR